MAVSGSSPGPSTEDPSPGEPVDPGGPPGAGELGGSADEGRGRMMKHAGPALRWLAWAAVGLAVVFE
jgi:hypothetical protein